MFYLNVLQFLINEGLVLVLFFELQALFLRLQQKMQNAIEFLLMLFTMFGTCGVKLKLDEHQILHDGASKEQYSL